MGKDLMVIDMQEKPNSRATTQMTRPNFMNNTHASMNISQLQE
jgi:hypothetical protein